MKQKVLLQPAYVLHRRPYRETSLLLEIFSQDYGRWPIIAKSARRSRSPYRGNLEPFQETLISWTAKGEIGTLTTIEPITVSNNLYGTALVSSFYLNELLIRLLPRQDPYPELFKLYGHSLRQLAVNQNSSLIGVQQVLRIFEKRLLEALGYGLLLNKEAVTGQAVDPNGRYGYDFEQGPIRLNIENNAGANVTSSISGKSLLELFTETLSDEESLRDIKLLMRAALKLHLDNRPLQSRQLLNDLDQIMHAGNVIPVSTG